MDSRIDNPEDYLLGVGTEIVFPTAGEAASKTEDVHESAGTEEYLIVWLACLAAVIVYSAKSGKEQLKTTQDQTHKIYWCGCFRSDRLAEIDLAEAVEKAARQEEREREGAPYPLRSFAFPYVRRYILRCLLTHGYKAEFTWNLLRNEWILTVSWEANNG